MPKIQEQPAADERTMMFPELTVAGHTVEADELLIPLDVAKEFLGWVEEGSTDEKFGTDYLLILDEKKVRCTNNTKNRPFDEAHCRKLAQDILNGHWRMNGETIIIGQYGQVLSAQHRLIALVIACWCWEHGETVKGESADWHTTWPEQPVLQALVVCGVNEDRETVNTIDNTRPQTLSDVIYRDDTTFVKKDGKPMPSHERKVLCKTLEFAVRTMWHRTGAKNDAYSPNRTHSESMDFLSRHERLKRAVKHIHDQNGKDDCIKGLLPMGTASGLQYLMGCSDNLPDAYRSSDNPSEAEIKFSTDRWGKAAEFWAHLADNKLDGFKRVRKMIVYAQNDASSNSSVVNALIVNAWLCFVSNTPMTEKNLSYEWGERPDRTPYVINDGLERDKETGKLLDHPSCGGIDYGDPDEAVREEKAAAKAEADEKRAEAKKLEDVLKGHKEAPSVEGFDEALMRLHNEHPEKLLIFIDPNGGYECHGGDAARASKHTGVKPMTIEGMLRLPVATDEADMLLKKKVPLGVCGRDPKSKRYALLGEYLPGGGYECLPEAPPKPPEALPVVAGKKPVKVPAPAEKAPEKATKGLKGGK